MKRLTALLLLVLLTGCDLAGQISLPGWVVPGAPATPTPAATAMPEEGIATDTPEAEPVPATATPVPSLTLWVPPEFDPQAGTPAGSLLESRLREFSRQNGGVRVIVRVKAASGPGGLLESLNAAYSAAPLRMPSVIALPRPDLEAAALKGLIQPLDGASVAIDEADWYDYARQLAMVQGTTFALPFAGDALLIVYRPAMVAAPPADWAALERLAQPAGFAAGDAQSLFVLTLYQSLGGPVEDAQRRPMLDPAILSQVLQVLARGTEQGIFPAWLAQYETNAQVWQAYQDMRVNAAVTWSSNYLSSLPPDTSAVALPSLSETPLTLATGWGWSVSEPLPERRALAFRLAEFLADGEFVAQWTEAAGFLPARPSALAAWTNQSLKTLLSPVAVSARARPSIDQLNALGPALREAVLKVLKGESDPAQAAQTAAERLSVPENR